MTLPTSPLALLELVSIRLLKSKHPFAVVGGLAASIYRSEPRLTKDVDIALAVSTVEESKDFAIKLIAELGFQPALGWIGMAGEKLTDPVALVIGRHNEHDLESTIDILLPARQESVMDMP